MTALVCFRNKMGKKKTGHVIVCKEFGSSVTFYGTIKHYDNNKLNIKFY